MCVLCNPIDPNQEHTEHEKLSYEVRRLSDQVAALTEIVVTQGTLARQTHDLMHQVLETVRADS
jgi:hypothetical protein